MCTWCSVPYPWRYLFPYIWWLKHPSFVWVLMTVDFWQSSHLYGWDRCAIIVWNTRKSWANFPLFYKKAILSLKPEYQREDQKGDHSVDKILWPWIGVKWITVVIFRCDPFPLFPASVVPVSKLWNQPCTSQPTYCTVHAICIGHFYSAKHQSQW